MKHPKTSCECSAMAGPLSLRWRCPACGRTATIKVSALAADCDGDMMREVEAEVARVQQLEANG
jgi:hypothetical protein